MKIPSNTRLPHLQRYMLTGFLTIIPLAITWFVLHFLFTVLSTIGTPVVQTLLKTLAHWLSIPFPSLAESLLRLDDPLLHSIIAVVLSLVAMYILGLITTLVIGKQIIQAFDSLMGRLPLIQTVYGLTKQFLSTLQTEPDKVQRVVLIEFPSPGMKVVGFVTRTLKDADTGELLAAVYVPTTPNPTSGYLEIVPLDKIVSTDWTIDEAMTFIISGGTAAPEHLHYSQSVSRG